jgi:ATP-dependent DNA ligase
MPNQIFPVFVPPVMAESAKTPLDSPDWIFEIKLDGYRALAVFGASGKPRLAVSKLKLRSTILNGEIVAVDENGTPRFQHCKNSKSSPRRRPSTMSLTCCGAMERHYREKRSATTSHVKRHSPTGRRRSVGKLRGKRRKGPL